MCIRDRDKVELDTSTSGVTDDYKLTAATDDTITVASSETALVTAIQTFLGGTPTSVGTLGAASSVGTYTAVPVNLIKDVDFLPLEKFDSNEEKQQIDRLFEPSKEDILTGLIPKHINVQLWQFLLESYASEQAARMLAMENATENAGEMIKDLGLQYNKARQSAITTEIIEIVSGANALSS